MRHDWKLGRLFTVKPKYDVESFSISIFVCFFFLSLGPHHIQSFLENVWKTVVSPFLLQVYSVWYFQI